MLTLKQVWHCAGFVKAGKNWAMENSRTEWNRKCRGENTEDGDITSTVKL